MAKLFFKEKHYVMRLTADFLHIGLTCSRVNFIVLGIEDCYLHLA